MWVARGPKKINVEVRGALEVEVPDTLKAPESESVVWPEKDHGGECATPGKGLFLLLRVPHLVGLRV